MADDLSSLPLHPGAKAYYQEAGYLPSKPPIDWLAVVWRGLAILVMVIGGYKGLITLRRDRTGNAISRRILAMPLGASVSHSVGKLLEIRDEIQQRVRRRWWSLGELNKSRWRYLHDLIESQIEEAKGNLTRALVAEIRTLAKDRSLDAATRREHQDLLEERIWRYFERGELDASNHEMLLNLSRQNKERTE